MKYSMKSSVVVIGLFFVFQMGFGQHFLTPADSLSIKRRNAVFASHTLGGIGTLSYLSIAWYGAEQQSRFHWFNDNDQWLGMDKWGHAITAYQITRIGEMNYKWTGCSAIRSRRNAALTSLIFLSSIEILDGFSPLWGASWGDLLSNVSGIGLAYFNNENHLIQYNMKFSFRPNNISDYRPEVLGSNLLEQSLKNYNGQTYWLTFSHKNIVPWLGFSMGYGADGMTGGKENVEINEAGENVPNFIRTPITRLSLDVQLDKIHTSYPWLNTVLKGMSFIKIPFPSIDYRWKEGKLGASWY